MKKKKTSKKNKSIFVILGIVAVIVVIAIGLVVFLHKGAKSDRAIIDDYLANQGKEYTSEEQAQIATAYKNLLETEGEEYVDGFMTQEEQTGITLMGMMVNVYVFRDFKTNGYLNSDNSFIDVTGFSTIAGFDVDGAMGADGFVNLDEVEITIDGKLCATANLRDEIASFTDRFKKANETEKTATIYGVDMVDIDESTRIYITYLDVQYDSDYNVTYMRVSGHLLQK